jgi:hypothetical protein
MKKMNLENETISHESRSARLVSFLLATPLVGAVLSFLFNTQPMAGNSTGPA